MRRSAVILAILFAIQLLTPQIEAAVITTAAGGGPDHMPALQANLGQPTVVVQDGAGNTYIAVQSDSKIFRIDPAGILTLFAGGGFLYPGLAIGDGGPAVGASVQASGLAVDASGSLYISDNYHNRIRKVDVATGIISTVAGGGPASANHGDGGPALNADLTGPQEIAIDASGNLYIADTGINRIRRVDAASQIITTYAGGGPFSSNYGNGGPATGAYFDLPTGVGLDSAGNLYIADTNHYLVWRVDASSHIITFIAGDSSLPWLYPRSPKVDSAGNVYFVAIGRGTCPNSASEYSLPTVYRMNRGTGIPAPFAGGQCAGFSGDGGPATSAQLAYLTSIGIATNGDLMVPDTTNYRLRVVSSGIITTRAGNGLASLSGDGFPATSASVLPRAVALDSMGNLFIGDTYNDRVRRVDASTGIIETFAGGGTSLAAGPMPRTDAFVRAPASVVVDHAGNVYIADPQRIGSSGAGRIWRVDAGSDQIYAFSGGVSGGVSTFYGLAVDLADKLYVSADASDRVYVISPACFVCPVAGSGTEGFSGDGGPALAAQMRNPRGLAMDPAGNMYIVDSGNQRVRRVDAATGVITTVAGNGTRGFGGDGGPGTSAMLADPHGVAIDSNGAILITDAGNERVRRLDPATGIITTVAGNGSVIPLGEGGDPLLAGLVTPEGIAAGPSESFFIAEEFGNSRVRLVSSRPVAHAGNYPPAECTGSGSAVVVLDGSTSVAPAGAIMLFEWFEDFGLDTQQLLGTGETLAVTLPVGTHNVTLRVTDTGGATDTDSISVVVRDSVAPALTCPPPRFFGCASGGGTTISGFIATVADACSSATVTNDHNSGGLDASGFYPVGTTTVIWDAVDGAGNHSTCSQTVTVEANTPTPPTVQVTVSPSVLKPHNHRMVHVHAQVSVESVCGGASFVLTSLTSNEPDDAPGNGDGSTINDIQEATIGSPDIDFLLRAERDNNGDGRVYTIVYTATDVAGHTGTGSAEVLVPKKGNIKPQIQPLDPPPTKGGKKGPPTP